MNPYGAKKDTRREDAKKLIEADLIIYGCLSLTLSRTLVKKKGFTFPAVASMTQEIRSEIKEIK